MSAASRAAEVMSWLESQGTQAARDGLARYGIPTAGAFGVAIGTLQKQAKVLGRDHALAQELWATGRYEARLLAAYVDDPAQVTAAQMGRWVREFDSWAITDTVCFALFDRTPHAWKKVAEWSRHREEFVKRAAFALLASLAAHDKACGDTPFIEALPLVERAASDERNFVKKGVIWALRSLGRRSLVLNQAAIELAARLAASAQPTERSIGKETLRELKSATVQRQVTKKKAATGKRSTAPRKAATRQTATKRTATRKGSR